MSALEELSNKISEVYDLELVEELTEIFGSVVEEYEEMVDAYKQEVTKSEALEKYSGVGKEMYREKCEELVRWRGKKSKRNTTVITMRNILKNYSVR